MGKPDLKEIVRKTLGDHTELSNYMKEQIANQVNQTTRFFHGEIPELIYNCSESKMARGYFTWLEKNLEYKNKRYDWVNPKMSEFGKLIADILGNVWYGLHHMKETELFHKRTDWSDDRFIEIVIYGELSTWDFNKLTKLVVLCHDNEVRMEINGANINYLRIYFHKREGRTGSISKRHPTIEEQIQKIRGHTE